MEELQEAERLRQPEARPLDQEQRLSAARFQVPGRLACGGHGHNADLGMGEGSEFEQPFVDRRALEVRIENAGSRIKVEPAGLVLMRTPVGAMQRLKVIEDAAFRHAERARRLGRRRLQGGGNQRIAMRLSGLEPFELAS